jgi:hypothetical protein
MVGMMTSKQELQRGPAFQHSYKAFRLRLALYSIRQRETKMAKSTLLILAVVLGAIIVLAFKQFRTKIITQNVESDIKAVYPYWAAQSPFKNGTESANAFKGAWFAVHGSDALKNVENIFQGHKESYDSDPSEWLEIIEDNRSKIADADPGLVKLASSYAAMENLNSDFVGEKGYKLELIKDSDGNPRVVAKHIETGEIIEISSEDNESDEFIEAGEYLQNTDLEEGKELLKFLIEWHEVALPDQPVTPYAIGIMLNAFQNYRAEGVVDNRDLEIVVGQFSVKYDAFMQAIELNRSKQSN